MNVAVVGSKLGSRKNPVDENTTATLSPMLRFGRLALPIWKVTLWSLSTPSYGPVLLTATRSWLVEIASSVPAAKWQLQLMWIRFAVVSTATTRTRSPGSMLDWCLP